MFVKLTMMHGMKVKHSTFFCATLYTGGVGGICRKITACRVNLKSVTEKKTFDLH